MELDLPTLMVASGFVAAISGMFLIFAWLQDRETIGMLWWASGNLVLAAAGPMLAVRDVVFGVPSTVVAILLLNISPALIWAAARSCNGRRVSPLGVASGAIIWFIAFSLPMIRESPGTQMSLNLGIVTVYLFAAALEFWRGRSERLQARWPLVVLLFLHGLFFAIGTVEASVGVLPLSGAPTLGSWFGLIQFETLVFVIGTAIFTVAMARERGELRHMSASRIDPLTSVENRRAFMETAAHLLAESLRADDVLSLIMFDLDSFKRINDTFGHGAGDRVLRIFADLARKSVRAGDLIGRPGGEEFAVLLPGASAGTAYVIAERIRAAFADACSTLEDRPLNATVSAGISTAHPRSTLESLIGTADEALYRAKAHGRNRVVMFGREVEDAKLVAA